MRKLIVFLFAILFTTLNLTAQYFGQNKPRYETFDFEVVESPHFEIYHYLEDPDKLKELALYSEQWYEHHQHILKDTLDRKNPLIFYNNHADFQQTNAISGRIGVGTGGVTEGLKNRVIMPLAMSNRQTHHVLGHELVHAFQYHMIIQGDSTNLRSLQNLPLWMVEGLAEYLSIGRVDAHTSMWMRDALMNDNIPELKKLQNPKYFPYRYGQAFWAFVTGVFGDDIIEPLFVSTAQFGLEEAVRKELGVNLETLSNMWQSALKNHYGLWMPADKKQQIPGSPLFEEGQSGHINIAPKLSPNGNYVIFLSEKDLFSIDLYLAEAVSGKIIRKVTSRVKEGHLDDYNYIESAGTWSPDSRRFATVAFKKGRNVLVVKEVLTGKTLDEIVAPGVTAFTNPAWSPDGNTIVFSGLVDGQIDLFAYDLSSGKVWQLTKDAYSEMQPDWSPDGSMLTFATDQLSKEGKKSHGKWTFNIAVMDWATKKVNNLDLFPGADNLNPVFDRDNNLVFLSDRDGFRNMYFYKMASDSLFQLTDLFTGVSGITAFSPAISVAGKRNRLVYTLYEDGKYMLYRDYLDKMEKTPILDDTVRFEAATLPVVGAGQEDQVYAQLTRLDEMVEEDTLNLKSRSYNPKFRLDYIGGGTGLGVGGGYGFGTTAGVQGGVDMLFSDILGNNQMYTGISLNGQIQDFAGVLAYVNRKNKLAWGGSISHIPALYGFDVQNRIDTLVFDDGAKVPALVDPYYIVRRFEERASLFGQLPFSRTLRVEAGGSFSHYSYSTRRYEDFYVSNRLFQRTREKEDLPGFDSYSLFSVNTALVGDNTAFGLASPATGYRYRLEVEKYFGEFDFFNITADYRRYVRLKPFTLGFRALHFGRYGHDAGNDQLEIFVGSSYLVRGYDALDLNGQSGGPTFDQLMGSKILVTNFEVRLPFTGPKRLAFIPSNFLFTELAWFVDGGMAWTDYSEFTRTDESGNPIGRPKPVFSTGVSLRLNLFGAMVLEPFYAWQIKHGGSSFGLNIVPGW